MVAGSWIFNRSLGDDGDCQFTIANSNNLTTQPRTPMCISIPSLNPRIDNPGIRQKKFEILHYGPMIIGCFSYSCTEIGLFDITNHTINLELSLSLK